jgi:hypothetical protein
MKFEFVCIPRVPIYETIAETQVARKLMARFHVSTCLFRCGEFISGSRKQATETCPVFASPPGLGS